VKRSIVFFKSFYNILLNLYYLKFIIRIAVLVSQYLIELIQSRCVYLMPFLVTRWRHRIPLGTIWNRFSAGGWIEQFKEAGSSLVKLEEFRFNYCFVRCFVSSESRLGNVW